MKNKEIFYCVYCGKRLAGNKKKYCNNTCKCKYFYKTHKEQENKRSTKWIQSHYKPRVNNSCKLCGTKCGRKKYCSDKCKPLQIRIPQEHIKEYMTWGNRFNSECNVCEKTFFLLHIHHKDGNHSNNNKENLIAVCSSCHKKIHTPSLRNKTENKKLKELRIILN